MYTMTANGAIREAAGNSALTVASRIGSVISTLILPFALLYINSINNQLGTIQATLNGTAVQLSVLQTKVEALDGNYRSLESQVYKSTDALRDFKLRDQQIETLSSQVTELKSRFINIEDRIMRAK